MHSAPKPPGFSRVFDRLVIIAGFSAVLVGCTTVASRLTGVIPERSLPTTCIGYCRDLYASLVSQEGKLRDENFASCRVLPQPQRGACLEEEGVRHAAEMARLEQLKANCLSNCAKDVIPPG